MDPPDQHHDGDDGFLDAPDDFPFHDCKDPDESVPSTSASALTESSSGVASPASTLRRRSKASGPRPDESVQDASSTESPFHDPEKSDGGKRYILDRDLKEKEKNVEVEELTSPIQDLGEGDEGDEDEKKKKKEEVEEEESTVTNAKDEDEKKKKKKKEEVVVEEEEEESTVTNAKDDRVGDTVESTWPSQGREARGLGHGNEEKKEEEATVTSANNELVSKPVHPVDELGDSGSLNLLVFFAGLVIKAIGFQFSLFISFFTFPLWVLYYCYILVVDPCRAIRRSRRFLMRKLVSLWKLIGACFSALLGDWLVEQKTVWELLLRFGWGLFWSIYVGIVLCGLLVVAAMASVFLMRFLVEEPMQLTEDLNFDYTKPSPVAFVPIISCDSVVCGANCERGIVNAMNSGLRGIPRDHKLQARVLLTLPESEYNRNLGIFQVRVDFFSADGKIIASKSQPSMLKFKSDPIRLLWTVLEIVPLLAGYASESQNLELKIRGFTEGDVPTSCLKVTIEQRAEFKPGAGIPEIYDAALVLESELPFLKRIIWSWKKTLFIWITITVFVTELVFALICCRPLIMPKVRLRDGSSINNVPERR